MLRQMKSYRYDNRSESEFARHISECHKIERTLMKYYVNYLNRNKRKDTKYSFKDNGCDNTGNLIKNDKKVTTDADFLLLREGMPDRKIDIKFSKKDGTAFHLKVNQLKQYIKNDVCIICFCDAHGPNTRFCIITPAMQRQMLNAGKFIKFPQWGNKLVVKCLNSEHDWFYIQPEDR